MTINDVNVRVSGDRADEAMVLANKLVKNSYDCQKKFFKIHLLDIIVTFTGFLVAIVAFIAPRPLDTMLMATDTFVIMMVLPMMIKKKEKDIKVNYEAYRAAIFIAATETGIDTNEVLLDTINCIKEMESAPGYTGLRSYVYLVKPYNQPHVALVCSVPKDKVKAKDVLNRGLVLFPTIHYVEDDKWSGLVVEDGTLNWYCNTDVINDCIMFDANGKRMDNVE